MRFLKCPSEFIPVSANGLLTLSDAIILFFCISFRTVTITIIKHKGNICRHGYYIWNAKSTVGLFVKIVRSGWYWVIVESKHSEERYHSSRMRKSENTVRFPILEESFNAICNLRIERASHIVVNFTPVASVPVKFQVVQILQNFKFFVFEHWAPAAISAVSLNPKCAHQKHFHSILRTKGILSA